MMLFNMINLAPFERKQTSERVALNFHSRALRGLSNGGCNILGYDRDPTNSGKFIINEDESFVVRRVFDLYLNSTSLAETAKLLMDEGHRPKVRSEKRSRLAREGKWTIHSVRHVLKNKAYIGVREINKQNKNEDHDHLKAWQKYQTAPAAWPAIVSEQVFLEAEKALQEGLVVEKQRLSFATKRIFLLSGIIRCGSCGHALVGQTSHGRNKAYSYYGHSKIDKNGKSCVTKNIRSKEIETAVLDHLDQILISSGHLDKIENNINSYLMASNADLKRDKDLKEKCLIEIESEIDSMLKFQFRMDSKSQSSSLIAEKLEKLAEKRNELMASLDVVVNNLNSGNEAKQLRFDLEVALQKFNAGWKKANPIVQKRFLRRIFDCLIYTREGLKVFYHADTQEIQKRQNKFQIRAGGEKPLALSFSTLNQSLRKMLLSSNLLINGASDCMNGAV